MPLTFYYLSGSPFSWKVWMSLEHLRVPYDLRVVSADAGDLGSPDFRALNPRGKVPVIVDDGFVLAESSVIVEYLEERHARPGARLWPVDDRARALARKTAAEGDAYIYPHVRKLVVELLMRKAGTPETGQIDEARAALRGELAGLDSSIQDAFLAGPSVTAADFTVYPFLAVLNRVATRKPEHRLGEVVPKGIAAWMVRVEALPVVARTMPPHWRTI